MQAAAGPDGPETWLLVPKRPPGSKRSTRCVALSGRGPPECAAAAAAASSWLLGPGPAPSAARRAAPKSGRSGMAGCGRWSAANQGWLSAWWAVMRRLGSYASMASRRSSASGSCRRQEWVHTWRIASAAGWARAVCRWWRSVCVRELAAAEGPGLDGRAAAGVCPAAHGGRERAAAAATAAAAPVRQRLARRRGARHSRQQSVA